MHQLDNERLRMSCSTLVDPKTTIFNTDRQTDTMYMLTLLLLVSYVACNQKHGF